MNISLPPIQKRVDYFGEKEVIYQAVSTLFAYRSFSLRRHGSAVVLTLFTVPLVKCLLKIDLINTAVKLSN